VLLTSRCRIGLLCAATLLCGSTARADDPNAERAARARAALLHDMEKIVEAQQATDWKIDRYEYDEMMPDALESLCATPQSVRSTALAELQHREAALGGPVEEAYRRSGGDLGAVRELRFVTRVRTLVQEAIRRAPAECPFWIEPSLAFRGKQTDAGRFTMTVEGGGLFVLYHERGKGTSLGGGGSGRLLFARGIDLHWSVLFGPDFGGAALFAQTKTGEFPVLLAAAVPLLLRHHSLTWHYDLELAPLAIFTNLDRNPSFGGRVGMLLGISTPRFRRIMPWAGLGIAAEFTLPNETRAVTRAIKGGLRLGFDWDFSGEYDD
jgi:hypothetical protein